MYITLQTDYAIRIVDNLARNIDLRNAKEISEEMSVPLRFAKNILQILAANEIVTSYKGFRGGYELAKPPREISLYDIFKAMDEPVILNRCLKKDYQCSCSPEKHCIYYNIFTQISAEIETRLRAAKFSSSPYNILGPLIPLAEGQEIPPDLYAVCTEEMQNQAVSK